MERLVYARDGSSTVRCMVRSHGLESGASGWSGSLDCDRRSEIRNSLECAGLLLMEYIPLLE